MVWRKGVLVNFNKKNKELSARLMQAKVLLEEYQEEQENKLGTGPQRFSVPPLGVLYYYMFDGF